jgi:triosephosphate isomerase
LIGHSERRQYFGETNETVCKKVAACLASNILPVICIGESKDERESGAFFDVIKEQLEAFYPSVINLNDVIVAYEPVWAIGTGLTASDEQAQQVHAFIRKELSVKYGEDQASKVRLLYGGSAKPANIDGLLEQADIDGGLVGGASLKAADFSSMVTKAFKKAKS